MPQFRNETNGITHAGHILARSPKGIDAAQSNTKEHCVVAVLEVSQGHVTAQRLSGLHRNPADLKQPVNLARREIVGGFICRDAEFIQSASLGAGVKQGHVMAQHGKAMGTGQARRTSADNCHTLARAGGAAERVALVVHQRIGGMALQTADLDRLALGSLAHAGLFAKGFGRANAGAHAAKDVLVENGPRRRFGRAGLDLADEQRDVDGRGAGGNAGRIVAEITAVGGDGGLMRRKGRVQIGEIDGDLGGGQASGGDAGSHRIGHGGSGQLSGSVCHNPFFYQMVNFSPT